jgi:hypothetical protein
MGDHELDRFYHIAVALHIPFFAASVIMALTCSPVTCRDLCPGVAAAVPDCPPARLPGRCPISY